jgi:adhesin/invasin
LATSIGSVNAFPVASSLGGSSATVDGVAAPILYASPNQINFQIPFEVSGTAAVSVTSGGTQPATISIPIHNTAPGIFLLSQGWAAALNQDGSVNSAGNAAAGATAIAVYATGLGAVNPPVATGAQASLSSLSFVTATVTATIGSQPATVLFAGLAPGYVGLYQVNVVVPRLTPGNYPLQITAGGVAGNTAMVSVR